MGVKTIKFTNKAGVPYGIDNFSLTLLNIWELSQTRFMLIGEKSSKGDGHRNKDGVVNNNFIYDKTENTMREANFYFADPNNACQNYQIAQVFNLGKVSVYMPTKQSTTPDQ